MKLHARQKYDYRDLERGEAQLIRVGHALWRDRRKLGDTLSAGRVVAYRGSSDQAHRGVAPWNVAASLSPEIDEAA